MLPFYILHQTVLLSVGYFVVQWAIPDLLKWVIIVPVSFAIIMALYEFVVRRFNVMRVLFGMKPLKQAAPVATRPSSTRDWKSLIHCTSSTLSQGSFARVSHNH